LKVVAGEVKEGDTIRVTKGPAGLQFDVIRAEEEQEKKPA
jgi:hypothetical protein